MNEDRISQLSKRFRTHGVGRPSTASRNRERRSYYLDADLANSLDTAYRKLNHALYPKQVSKSLFLESIIQYGLEHEAEIMKLLQDTSEMDEE